MVSCDTGGNSRLEGASAHIFKNGSKILASDMNFNDNEGRFATALVHGTVDMNGSTDYLELYGFIGYNAGSIIHILLVIAIIAVLLRIIKGK